MPSSAADTYAGSKYVDAQGRTDAETYLMGVLDGTIVAGQKMVKLAKKMLPRIRDGYKQWHYDVDAAIRPVEFIETFLCIPSGKLNVPFVLTDYERMIVELTFGFVDDNGARMVRFCFVEIARKNGKACSTSTQLPTPNGWRTMGDIHPGDYVFGQDGKPSMVIAESEIFDKETYRVTFEDGAVVDTSGDHIWTVQTKRSRRTMRREPGPRGRIGSGKRYREGGWFETTTQEMFDDPLFVYHRADGKGVEYKYRVPMCLPVEYPEKVLPVDPYTFGYWLGDGSSNSAQLTIGLEDLDESVSRIESLGHTCSVHHSHDNAYRIVVDSHGMGRPNTFVKGLREAGVLRNKHIPDVYLQGSVEQRWELLRGLMDTDGYVSKAGQCQFTQKSKMLVEQFVELCSSLGIKANMHSKEARCNGKPAGTVYVVEFWTDKAHSCFHLKRKHDRLKDKLADRMRCKSIVSIERIPNEPTKCIAIDNPSHLYLVGRQYTATHNTSLGAAITIFMLLAAGEGAPQCYFAASSRSQASIAFGHVWKMVNMSPKLKKYLRKGTVVERGESGVICDKNMGYCIPLSKQTDHLDGLDVFFALLDELASWKDRAAYDLLRQGTSARESPLLMSISTNGFVRDGVFDKELEKCNKWLDDEIEDDSLLAILFEQDSRDEIWSQDPEIFRKSNPGLGTVKSLETLQGNILNGHNDPSFLPTLLIKDFNWPATSATSFLTYEEACNFEKYEFDPKKFRYCVCGFDAADTIDLNAATALFMTPGDDHIYRYSRYWICSEQMEINSNNQRGRDGGIPYQEYINQGILTVVEGNKVPRKVFLDFIDELHEMGMFCVGIGYDRWGFAEIEDRMKSAVGSGNVMPIAMGSKSLSTPMKQLKAEMRSGRIIDNGNGLDHACNMNCTVKTDVNGNIQPVKKDGATTRIDGFIALLCSYIYLMNHWDDYQMCIGA